MKNVCFWALYLKYIGTKKRRTPVGECVVLKFVPVAYSAGVSAGTSAWGIAF